MVAACPAPWQVSAQASNGEGVRENAGVAHDAFLRSRRPWQLLAEFCQTQQIPFCDVSNTFVHAEQPEHLYLKNAATFSATGHTLYARELAEFLRLRVPVAAPASPGYAPLPPQARRLP